MNRDNSGNSIDLILVCKCPQSLSDYRKEEIIRSINLIRFRHKRLLNSRYTPPQ